MKLKLYRSPLGVIEQIRHLKYLPPAADVELVDVPEPWTSTMHYVHNPAESNQLGDFPAELRVFIPATRQRITVKETPETTEAIKLIKRLIDEVRRAE